MAHWHLSRLVVLAAVTGGGCPPAVAAPAPRPGPDPGWIRVVEDGNEGKAALFRPDGTGRKEATVAAPKGQPSPDGKSILYVRSVGGDDVVFVADGDGKNEKRVSPNKFSAGWPCWSPDGKRVAFLGQPRGGPFQVHVADRNGRNLQPVSDAPLGAVSPRFAPDGRLSYLTLGKGRGKLLPTDLVIRDGAESKPVLSELFISDYAWSPDGKTIAYGRPGALVFLDVGTGRAQAVAYENIDARASGHMATGICWSPDGKVVACAIGFVGDRQARPGTDPPRMFGDDEIFVIPRAGKPTWFDAGARGRRVDWVKDK